MHAVSQKRKETGRKPMATADLSKPLNPGWLHLWIIIKHEVMLTLSLCIYLNAKQQMTTESFASGEGPQVISGGGTRLMVL